MNSECITMVCNKGFIGISAFCPPPTSVPVDREVTTSKYNDAKFEII